MTRNDFQHNGDHTPCLLDPLPGPLNERPRVGPEDARAMLAAAVLGLGLELGDYDRRILAYLSADDSPTVAAIASIIYRARQENSR
jgi:hypothetical protein